MTMLALALSPCAVMQVGGGPAAPTLGGISDDAVVLGAFAEEDP